MRVYAPVGGWLGGNGNGVVVFDDRRSKGESCWMDAIVCTAIVAIERESVICMFWGASEVAMRICMVRDCPPILGRNKAIIQK